MSTTSLSIGPSVPNIVTYDYQQSPTIGKLAEALAKAQAQMGHAVKDAQNPHFRSKYADIAAVVDACLPLAENGIARVQIPVDRADGRVGLHSRLVHSSGEYIGGTFSIKADKDNAHGAGSALTYLRRYSLQALAGIASDDDDGNAASGRSGNGGGGATKTIQAAPAPQPDDDKANDFIDRGRQVALHKKAMDLFDFEVGGNKPTKKVKEEALRLFLKKAGYVGEDGEGSTKVIPMDAYAGVEADLAEHAAACRKAASEIAS